MAVCHHCHQRGFKDCDLQQRIQNGRRLPCNNCDIFIKTGHPHLICYASVGEAVTSNVVSKPRRATDTHGNHGRSIPSKAVYGSKRMSFMPAGYASSRGFNPHLQHDGLRGPYLQHPIHAPFQPYQSHMQTPGLKDSMRSQPQLNEALRDGYETGQNRFGSRELPPQMEHRIEDPERENNELKLQMKEQKKPSGRNFAVASRPQKRKLDSESVDELDRIIAEASRAAEWRDRKEQILHEFFDSIEWRDTEERILQEMFNSTERQDWTEKVLQETIDNISDAHAVAQRSRQEPHSPYNTRHNGVANIEARPTRTSQKYRKREHSTDRYRSFGIGDRSWRGEYTIGDYGGARLAENERTNLDYKFKPDSDRILGDVDKYRSDRCR